MKVAFACDHAGFALKEAVIAHLKEMGHEVVDFGCYTPERVDYPAQGEKAARAVASGECALGVLICGTGIGISLAANRVHGIRAAVCSESYSAELTRRHNDANMIAFGARVVGEGTACAILDAFFGAKFEGGRHAQRVAMLDEIRP
ncbi:MAG: ribose 5-phosphate isomerase B [Clostridiales bacterium]|nr:ribose 5-phosphate isomerase B [Clostridiales bacterium]MDY2871028.1 ribose 5-phosphate isomerase B [Eubacteriales bacterium]